MSAKNLKIKKLFICKTIFCFVGLVFFQFINCVQAAKTDSDSEIYNKKTAQIAAQKTIHNHLISKKALYLLRYGEEGSRKEYDHITKLEIKTTGCEITPNVEIYINTYNTLIKNYWLNEKV